MEMRACAVAGTAHVSDDLTPAHLLAGRDGHGRLVGVEGRQTTAMIDHDGVAVAASHPGGDNDAIRRRGNGRAGRGAHVPTGMEPAGAEDGLNPIAELCAGATRHLTLYRT